MGLSVKALLSFVNCNYRYAPRVTRLGEVLLIGRIFAYWAKFAYWANFGLLGEFWLIGCMISLGSFLKISQRALLFVLLFSAAEAMC
jgi:hypothetical protein